MQHLTNTLTREKVISTSNPSISKVTVRKYKTRKDKFNYSAATLLLIFAIVFSISSSIIFAQTIRQADYYFDGISGNNSNNGLTPQTAKKDLDGLANLGSAIQNKTIAFKDGIYYRRTSSSSAAIGVSYNNVRITNWYEDASWRNGDKLPIIAASYKISDWTNVSGNIWQATSSGANTLIFAYPDSIRWGIARSSQSALTKECDFFRSGTTYYIYSPTDPDTRYESIDSPRQSDVLSNSGDNNKFDHLDLRYSSENNVMFEPSGSNPVLRDCIVRFSGSSQGLMNGQDGGEGVYLHAGGSKCINNFITENTRHAIFVYNTTSSPFNDVTIDSNLLVNGHYNFFDMNGGTISDIKIRYNIAYETDWEAYRQESNYNERNGGFWTNGGIQDVLIAYNLVYNMYDVVLFDCRVGQITVHNNTFVQTRSGSLGDVVIYTAGGSGSVFTNNILARNGGSVGNVPSGSSNNISTNNLSSVGWVDWQQGNFRLTAGSSAINYGVNLGYTKDLDGNPIISLPDASAYEYNSGGGGNNPPNVPSNPNPVNAATNQPVNLTLGWSCTDPDGNPLTYDIYFGTNSNPPVVSTNQSNTNYNPGQLVNSTTYYWKIVARDNQGATRTGPVWNFITVSGGGNNPPNQPSNPNPVNSSTNRPVNSTLGWSCTDPDGNPLTFDVYFGINSNPPIIASNQTSNSFNPGLLNGSTTYYWKIVAKDNQGASTTGPIWNFSTVNVDVIPPEVVSAVLLTSTSVKVVFSEPLQQSGAQNIANYSVSNSINVTAASLSGSTVTLTTSSHISGTYTVTVINVKDLAGNLISPLHNSAQYSYSTDTTPPEVIAITVISARNVTVKFSEKLEPTKAKNRNNYRISNNVYIYSVELLPDSSSVLIRTNTQQRNRDYSLTMTNISDRAGNYTQPNPKVVYYRLPRRGNGYMIQIPVQGVFVKNMDQNFLPKNTIDGKGMKYPESRWQSSNVMPDTLIFDLGNEFCLDSLRISFYEWQSKRLYKYSVNYSVDSVNWHSIIINAWSEAIEWTEIEFDSTNARYVELILQESNDNSMASIWEIEFYGPDNSLKMNNENETPNSFMLSQNYPNPFNPSTSFKYSIAKQSKVLLRIYDIIGNEIVTLVNEEKSVGTYELTWDASNLPSGVYLYQLKAGDFIQTKKMILMK